MSDNGPADSAVCYFSVNINNSVVLDEVTPNFVLWKLRAEFGPIGFINR